MTHFLLMLTRSLWKRALPGILLGGVALLPAPALAEGGADDPHAGHDMHGTHAPVAPMAPADQQHRHVHPPAPVPPATDAAQAQGLATEPSAPEEHGGRHESHGGDRFLWLRGDQIEVADGGDGTALDWKGSLSWGDTFNRVWLASEGEREDGGSHELQTRLFWSHAVSPWWDATLGLRQDNGSGASRSWAGIGLRGLAPYWFETEATLYAGEGGQALLEIDVDYELLLTNRLILEPELELRAHGRDDAARGEGAGLADSSIGLRLRYELSRKFAPYVGIEWTQRHGSTRNLAEAAGERVHDTRAVAGLRFWY